METQVYFDGVVWVARRAGCPGKVFGATRGEALLRVTQWMWTHMKTEVFRPHRKGKK